MKKLFLTSALSAAMFMTATTANAADYVIDTLDELPRIIEDINYF